MAEPLATTPNEHLLTHPELDALEFPGCRPVHISPGRIAEHEDRFEFWDVRTEVAMVCEPVTTWHEQPAQRLRGLATLISMGRGSPIETYGRADLTVVGPKGEPRRIMQADQSLFLSEQPDWIIKVGKDALPYVVLEVDLNTDVRQGKLSLYEAWGFPEVWVDVPDKVRLEAKSNRQPGLTIYVRSPQGFHESPVSSAFPTWTAPEIHRGLNEHTLSKETAAAVRRVGRALGSAEGTSPDEHPYVSEERRESRAEGRAEGRLEMLHSIVVQTLTTRGVSVPTALAEQLAEVGDDAAEAVMKAALTCRDEADFLRLLGRSAPS